MTEPLGVLVVADATSTRRRLRAVLAESPRFAVTAEADDVTSALAQARAARPDVVVLDLPLPADELTRTSELLRVIDPDVHVVVLPDSPAAEASLVLDLTDALRLAEVTEVAQPRPPRAIVCDDDAMTRRLVGQVLASLGVEVVADIDVVPNLLPVVLLARPELVILDLWLEGTTGLSAMPDLRTVVPRPAVIVYSAHDEWEERALLAGASAFVAKPGFEQLANAVRRFVPAVGHAPA